MTLSSVVAAVCLSCAAAGTLFALSEAPSTAPADWSPDPFDYDRPDQLDVREKKLDKASLLTVRQEEVIFKDLRGEDVFVLITLPESGEGPYPVAVLLHGFGSDKEQVSRQVARAMLSRGFACLAPDMPKHGERPGRAPELFKSGNPETTMKNVIQAITDIRQTIDLAESRKHFDTSAGVVLVGYSMGSWFSALAGSADRRVDAMVLMVGGSMTAETANGASTPANPRDLMQRFAPLRPVLAIPHFSPRPILMQNGKRDMLMPPASAEALYKAAGEPKEIRWYDSGHILPPEASKDAAEWLVKQLKAKKKRQQ